MWKRLYKEKIRRLNMTQESTDNTTVGYAAFTLQNSEGRITLNENGTIKVESYDRGDEFLLEPDYNAAREMLDFWYKVVEGEDAP